VVVWSTLTAPCGLARSFVSLFLVRIGVGIGEAGLTPAAFSMLADSFPAERRGRAMAAYTLGSNIGLGLALIVGGAIAQWAMGTPPIELSAGMVVQGWQLAFVVVSLPGPVFALFMFLVREPTARKPAIEVGPGRSS